MNIAVNVGWKLNKMGGKRREKKDKKREKKKDFKILDEGFTSQSPGDA